MTPPDAYLNFLNQPARCAHCTWRGTGAALNTGSPDDEGIEKFCPQCLALVAYAPWPIPSDAELLRKILLPLTIIPPVGPARVRRSDAHREP